MERLPSERTDDLRIAEAAEMVRRLGGDAPRPLAIITGSGLAGLAAVMSLEQRIAPEAIPHLPPTNVPGHPGGILLGRIGPLGAIFFAGRVHLYETWTAQESVFSVRLAARLGARILLVTNATGGINGYLRPGNLVLLSDQINLTFCFFSARFMSAESRVEPPGGPLYDSWLRGLMRDAARLEKINLKEGVYAGTLGPTYETRAEATMLAEIGADVVGMSTVAEALAARVLGLRTVGISCVANMVPRWGRDRTVTHSDVLESVGKAVEQLKRLTARWAEMVADHASG